MNRCRILILAFVTLFCWSCGDDNDATGPADALFNGPIAFSPAIWEGLTMGIGMEIFADGEERSVIIDTGSIYYFLGSNDNNQDLPCASPDSYSYGGGVAHFCPEETFLEAKNAYGSYDPLILQKIRMGRAYFTDWGGPPYAIMGLSANLIGQNREDMLSVIQQLKPDHLSFSFPEGLLNPGFFQFDGLQPSRSSAIQRIPLVSPGSLEYGYTARLSRIEYYTGNELVTAVVNAFDGVYVETAETRERVADDLIAFFDTGTTVPIVIVDGGVSLLSDRVPEDIILPEDSAPLYDQVVAVFEDESGLEISLSSGDVSVWQPGNPWARVLTGPPVPEGEKELVYILGLNFIGRYDFQFDFSGGKATHVTFLERQMGLPVNKEGFQLLDNHCPVSHFRWKFLLQTQSIKNDN